LHRRRDSKFNHRPAQPQTVAVLEQFFHHSPFCLIAAPQINAVRAAIILHLTKWRADFQQHMGA